VVCIFHIHQEAWVNWTGVVSHDSAAGIPPSHDAQSNLSGLGRKISAAMIIGQFEPTVVHRVKYKSRPSFPLSNDKELVEISPDGSPSNSGNDLSSGKSTIPRLGNSTGVTSVDSKASSKSKAILQHTAENKKTPALHATDGGSNEMQLTSIAEVEQCEEQDPVPSEFSCLIMSIYADSIPAVITVEQVAAAKVFFECYYNELTSGQITARSIRRRQLEGVLYQDTNLTSVEKDERRIFWARTESDHLRQTRSLKNKGSKALKGNPSPAANYEVVKILGKGSFGVVRLVREKDDQR